MINPEFEKFIDLLETQANVARFLECSEANVIKMRRNPDGISKVMAKRIVDSYPNLNALALMYPSESKGEAA